MTNRKSLAIGIINAVLNVILFILVINSGFYYRTSGSNLKYGDIYMKNGGAKLPASIFDISAFLGVCCIMVIIAGLVFSIIVIVKSARGDDCSNGFVVGYISVGIVTFIVNLFVFIMIFIASKSSTSGVPGAWEETYDRVGLSGVGIFYLILGVIEIFGGPFSAFVLEDNNTGLNKYMAKNKYKTTTSKVSPSKPGSSSVSVIKGPVKPVNVSPSKSNTEAKQEYETKTEEWGGAKVKIVDHTKPLSPSEPSVKEEKNDVAKSQSIASIEKKEKLEQLQFLFDSKVISEEEYKAAREKIINS